MVKNLTKFQLELLSVIEKISGQVAEEFEKEGCDRSSIKLTDVDRPKIAIDNPVRRHPNFSSVVSVYEGAKILTIGMHSVMLTRHEHSILRDAMRQRSNTAE